MRRFRRVIRAFRSEQQGVSVTEYGLLLAAVALALMLVVSSAGAEIRKFFDRATCTVYSRGCSDGTGSDTDAGSGGATGGDAAGGTGGQSGTGGTGANSGGGNNTGSNNNGGGNNTGSGR